MTLTELSNHTAAEFARICGQPPRWIAAAPGRVNVIGEHTDYNDGFVLPMAIERYTVIAAAPAAKAPTACTLRSTEKPGKALTIDLAKPLKPFAKGTWANYPAGVIAGFSARGISSSGFDAFIHSTVPLGGGLSSSAALEVATATLLEAITGQTLDPVDKALLCQQAEHEYAGVPCGIMDQFISVMGTRRSSAPARLPFPQNRTGAHERSVRRPAHHQHQRQTRAGQRRNTPNAAPNAKPPPKSSASPRCATPPPPPSSRPKTRWKTLSSGAPAMSSAKLSAPPRPPALLGASDWSAAGQLMYASHSSLRDDYEVSCAELDAVVEIARAIGENGGVYGCRMTGGGFGGCAVALVKTDAVEAVSKIIGADYRQKTGIEATLFVSRPAAGAAVLLPAA